MNHEEYQALYLVQSRHFWFRTLYNYIRDVITSESKKKGKALTVFDAGAGCGGLMLDLLDNQNISSVRGCEPYFWAYDLCRKNNLDVLHSDIEGLDHTLNYDIVACIDVLVLKSLDLAKAMQQLHSLTREGGLILINVAAMPFLFRNHDEKCGVGRRFTIKSLKKILALHDLCCEEIFYWNIILAPVLLLQAWIEKFERNFLNCENLDQKQSDLTIPSEFVNNIIYGILLLEKHFPMRLRKLFGSSLFVVARVK